MLRRLLMFAIVAMLAGRAAQAGNVELSFNDNNFDTWLTFGLGSDDDAQFQLGGRYLYSSSDEDDASLPGILAGFSSRAAGNDEIRFFVGAQGYVGEAQDQDIEGVGVGGGATWAPESWNGVFVGARLFYAPEVFCFGDTTGVFEWAGSAGYQINEKVRAFLQYSQVTADLETDAGDADVDIDTGVTIGIGIAF
jgi:hypothetical protein